MYRKLRSWAAMMDDEVLSNRLYSGKHPFRFAFTRRPYWSR